MGRRVSLSLSLCLCVVIVAPPKTFRAHAADRPHSTNVNFELYRDYLIVLQARVGPLKGLNFLLDTGATPSVLDPHTAARLHLQLTSAEIAVLQGTAHGATATVPSLQVGPVLKENLPVLVEDLSFVQKVVPVHLDGIVGLDVLGGSPFTIDYTTREIRFGPFAGLASSTPMESKQGLPLVNATMNGQSVLLLLDTGAPSLILFKRPPVPGIRAASFDVSSGSIGEYDHKSFRLSSLGIGSASFPHPSAYVVTTPGGSAHGFDGVMSPVALGLRGWSSIFPTAKYPFPQLGGRLCELVSHFPEEVL